MILDFVREINRYIHVDHCAGIRKVKKVGNKSLKRRKGEGKVNKPEKVEGETPLEHKAINLLRAAFKDKLTNTLNEKDQSKALDGYQNISDLIIGKE